MGLRVLELQTFRERLQKRRVRLLPMLQWVSSNVWKASWRHVAACGLCTGRAVFFREV